MTRRNVLERHTDNCSRHQRHLFSRSGGTRLSYNSRVAAAKHKILISASIFADTVSQQLGKLPPTIASASILMSSFRVPGEYTLRNRHVTSKAPRSGDKEYP